MIQFEFAFSNAPVFARAIIVAELPSGFLCLPDRRYKLSLIRCQPLQNRTTMSHVPYAGSNFHPYLY